MVDITNLETQVQNRIDSLTGTEKLEQLLEIKRASEFISVDTAALDTAIESRIASFDGSTDKIDLLLGNRLAINPYLQGGGGGAESEPNNSQEFLASGDFIVPAGVKHVYVTGWGAGGGGGGAIAIGSQRSAAAASGGGCGFFDINKKIKVTEGETIPVVIGAGGLSDSINTNTGVETGRGGVGGETSFGTYMTLLGGGGGGGEGRASSSSANLTSSGSIGGMQSSNATAQVFNGSALQAEQTVTLRTYTDLLGVRHGRLNRLVRRWSFDADAGQSVAATYGIDNINYNFNKNILTGVLNQPLPEGRIAISQNVTAPNAADNTGWGGGGAVSASGVTRNTTVKGGDGGSGYLLVEWFE